MSSSAESRSKSGCSSQVVVPSSASKYAWNTSRSFAKHVLGQLCTEIDRTIGISESLIEIGPVVVPIALIQDKAKCTRTCASRVVFTTKMFECLASKKRIYVLRPNSPYLPLH